MTNKSKLVSSKLTKLPRRNPLHNHPLLTKGGTHTKTGKALRRKEKVLMKKEWLPQNMFLREYFAEDILMIANK